MAKGFDQLISKENSNKIPGWTADRPFYEIAGINEKKTWLNKIRRTVVCTEFF